MRGQPIPAPELVAPSADPAEWIRPVGDPSIDRRDVEVVAGSPGDWTRSVDSGLAFHVTQQARRCRWFRSAASSGSGMRSIGG
jgi:hypothetical protein